MGNMILSKHLEHIWTSTHRLRGWTEFQVKVWNAMKEIPRGEIRTYTEIAVQIGHPNSARATVANACGQNPYPPIVCHVIAEWFGAMEVWAVIAV